jgi:hypothetical protein
LYTVRHPEVKSPLTELDDDLVHDAEILRPYVRSGGQHFSLGNSIETFASEHAAFEVARVLINLDAGTNNDKHIRWDLEQFPIGVHFGSYGTERFEPLGFTSIPVKPEGHELSELVTMT